jgi:tetratricopeptide (TPR) repeat protein
MKISTQKLLSRAEKLEKKGEIKEAHKLYLKVLELYPQNSQAKNAINLIDSKSTNEPVLALSDEQINSVMSLFSNGEFKETIDKINLLNIDFPNVPLLYNLLGACHNSIGSKAQAIKYFDIAISIKPDYAQVYYNKGVTFNELGQLDLAVDSYKKAIELIPNYPDAHNNLGSVLQKLGQFENAIQSYEWAIAYNPNFAEAHNNLGNVLSEYGRVDLSIKNYENAITLNPKYLKANFNLAMAFKNLGNKDGFIKYIEKVVTIKPEWGDAQLHLARVKKFKKNDPKINEMKSFLDEVNLDVDDRIGLNFALAHIFENHENFDEQFRFLNEGNRLQKQELNYNFNIDKNRFASIKKIFKNTSFDLKKVIKNETITKPIFIIGMPRSGTSLVHQIIASHSEVYGAGELNNLNRILAPFLNQSADKEKKEISDDDILSVRNQYIDLINTLNLNEIVILDKMPLNFRYVGFILSAFPEAKIIHMKRDPMATCWSIYKYIFGGNAYSYNQDDLAKYFCLYENLMSFWHDLFPGKIYDLSYENLTGNQEKETKQLLKYCKLKWEENCLNFHTNQSAVKTTSDLQVRRKIYQGSSEVWKKYEAYLQPLISGLDNYKT